MHARGSSAATVALLLAGMAGHPTGRSVLLLLLSHVRAGRVGQLALQAGLAALAPGFVLVARLRRVGTGADLRLVLVHGVGVLALVLPGGAGSSCQGVCHYDQQHKDSRAQDAHAGDARLILKH